MKEKLVTVLAEAGLTQMQRDPTRGQNLLDLFCCNKPSLVKSCISIPGISDHSIVLADCDLKTPISNKPQRRVYRWSKADWLKIKGLTTTFVAFWGYHIHLLYNNLLSPNYSYCILHNHLHCSTPVISFCYLIITQLYNYCINTVASDAFVISGS